MGSIPNAGVFRNSKMPTPPVDAGAEVVDRFEETCAAYVDELMGKGKPYEDQAKAVWAKSLEEQELGILGPWLTRQQLDDRYGRGR